MPFPVQKLCGVEIRTNDQRAIPAPLAGLGTARDESVRIHQPEATEAQPGILRQMKQAPREAGAGKFVLGGRVAGDRIGSFAAQLVEKRDSWFRRWLSAASRWQRGRHAQEHGRKAPNKARAKTIAERSEGLRSKIDGH